MSDMNIAPVLRGQKALVVGIANDQSIAYGCAKAFQLTGADLALTWLNEKARRFVEPLAQELNASVTAELNVSVPGQLERLFELIRARWGRLDMPRLAGSPASATQSDADPRDPGGGAGASASRLFRYGLSSKPAAPGAGFRHPAPVQRRRRATLRLSSTVLATGRACAL